MSLPGVCVVCRRPVVWRGKSWKNPGAKGKGGRHVCPPDRPVCGAMMRYALERCARAPGHADEHRTRYALDNANRMRTGRASLTRRTPGDETMAA